MENGTGYNVIFYNGGYIEFMGSSSDTKPTEGFKAGILTETDTGKVFFWDAKTSAWIEQFSFQS